MLAALALVVLGQTYARPCGPDAVRLAVGTQRVFHDVAIARAFSGSPFELALSDGELKVIGAEQGTGRLHYELSDGGVRDVPVTVESHNEVLFVSDVWRLAPCSDALLWKM